ncbi:MAG: hypothetical protein HY362_01620 [Candidatus Aenigmarchaeota archaeon]|nr:hypothetical protein [Candidatus Aenigmarchaeota archaeon]
MKAELFLELRRQAVHAFGIVVAIGVMFLPQEVYIGGLESVLIFFVLLSVYKAGKFVFIGRIGKLFLLFAKKFERPGELLLRGPIMFFAGATITAIIFPSAVAAAGIAVLALGDSASTIIGKTYGKHKIPWEGNRSWEGSIAFFIFALAACLLFQIPVQKAFAAAVLSAIIETIPILDDNLTVPIAAAAAIQLF